MFAEQLKTCDGNEACTILEGDRLIRGAMMSGALPKVSWEKIVDHIDHAVKVAGVEHVGLGSDFDGTPLPLGMEDASMLPKLTQALLDRNYSERDIQKILGGNILRVMEQVEQARGR
jgi:membrane dipeptidase